MAFSAIDIYLWLSQFLALTNLSVGAVLKSNIFGAQRDKKAEVLSLRRSHDTAKSDTHLRTYFNILSDI